MVAGLHVVFDCADPDKVARFWMTVLDGYDFPTMRDVEGNEFCAA